MELFFLLTGWDYAREGKKSTEFAEICHALGVTFDLRGAADGVLQIQNTEKRIAELVQYLEDVMKSRKLGRHKALKLRGRLGFADGFLHGRLGALILKRLVDYAYSSGHQFLLLPTQYSMVTTTASDSLSFGELDLVSCRDNKEITSSQ